MASELGFSRSIFGAAVAAGLGLALAGLSSGCNGEVRRFPLRAPVWTDTDFTPFTTPCTKDDKGKEVCVPEEYVSSFAWDGADNIVFLPISKFFAASPGGEAANVNSMDEVPDSSWFVNRHGKKRMDMEALIAGYCAEGGGGILRPETDAPGSWLIDQGKPNGANPGFRVRVEGAGKFMLKADEKTQPEKATGATAIATRLYYAAGWWAPCDSVVYVDAAKLLTLKPGLTVTDNTGVTKPFDQKGLEEVLGKAATRGPLKRFGSSRWLPGRAIGPFTYLGTREDDPNDIIPHEDRRDLRGARVIAAWLNHFDSREQNSMATWMAINEKELDSTPGYIRHWYLDLGDCFGSEWAWEGITRRLGHAYYLDIPYLVEDFLTLGLIERPWDRNSRSAEGDIFAYFSSDDFDPDVWRGGYPNPTFNRMTERDAAWATRIIARFTKEELEGILTVADYTKVEHREFLMRHLLVRQKKILERYFSKLSPIADVEVRNGTELCGVDLARQTRTYPETDFSYSAAMYTGTALAPAGKAPEVKVGAESEVCLTLEHFEKDGGESDDSYARYAIVDIQNGRAPGPLRAHLYDLGPAKGFQLAGLERPKKATPPL